VGKVYLHMVVDAYCSYAFGFLHTSKQSEAAALVLHNGVLSFYRQQALPVQAVLTDNGCEFCGNDDHPYELRTELGVVLGMEGNLSLRRTAVTEGLFALEPEEGQAQLTAAC
jgi:hypothetical protein